jgi:dipeptidyl aminopeptidase/acylaminoacyl peptidase
MVSTIKSAANGTLAEASTPTPLFPKPLADGATYAAARNGQFLVFEPIEPPPILLLKDWPRSTISSTGLPTRGEDAVGQLVPGNRAGRGARGQRGPSSAPTTARALISGAQQAAVFDRNGKLLSIVGQPVDGNNTVAISPNGARLAVVHEGALSVIEIASGKTTPIASNVYQRAALWSPDGSRVAYASRTTPGLFVRSATGEGPEERWYAGDPNNTWSWSLDGRFIAMNSSSGATGILSTTADHKFMPVSLSTGAKVIRLSPDASKIAYLSDESGVDQVFLRKLNPADPDFISQRTIIRSGAVGSIRWNENGKEFYYLSSDGWIMAVRITGEDLGFETPERLFSVPKGFPIALTSGSISDISADGQRFVFLLPVPTDASPPRP